jgi:hypothetical protein
MNPEKLKRLVSELQESNSKLSARTRKLPLAPVRLNKISSSVCPGLDSQVMPQSACAWATHTCAISRALGRPSAWVWLMNNSGISWR